MRYALVAAAVFLFGAFHSSIVFAQGDERCEALAPGVERETILQGDIEGEIRAFFRMLPSGNVRGEGEIRSRIKSFSERYPDVNQAALLAQGIKAACIGNRFDIIPVLFEIYYEFQQGSSSGEDDSSSPTGNDSVQDTADRDSIESQSRDLKIEFNDTAYSSGEIAFNVESCTLAFRQLRCDFRAINLSNNNIELEIFAENGPDDQVFYITVLDYGRFKVKRASTNFGNYRRGRLNVGLFQRGSATFAIFVDTLDLSVCDLQGSSLAFVFRFRASRSSWGSRVAVTTPQIAATSLDASCG
jgi:hypothetical protein